MRALRKSNKKQSDTKYRSSTKSDCNLIMLYSLAYEIQQKPNIVHKQTKNSWEQKNQIKTK